MWLHVLACLPILLFVGFICVFGLWLLDDWGQRLFVIAVVVAIIAIFVKQTPVDSERINTLKLPAHVDVSYRSDIELIAVDQINDVAYYKYTKPDYDVKQGDTVTLVGGNTAVIVSYDAIGFCVSGDGIVAGMSGTAIRSSTGVQIGYISERLEDGTVRCIWS